MLSLCQLAYVFIKLSICKSSSYCRAVLILHNQA
nr:MAG TPA: hypothetical protein [Caudoviricetes sp.]DAT07355.1 MAG TPA: hypothetical protein [Caudoviricetes sp.]